MKNLFHQIMTLAIMVRALVASNPTLRLEDHVTKTLALDRFGGLPRLQTGCIGCTGKARFGLAASYTWKACFRQAACRLHQSKKRVDDIKLSRNKYVTDILKFSALLDLCWIEIQCSSARQCFTQSRVARPLILQRAFACSLSAYYTVSDNAL